MVGFGQIKPIRISISRIIENAKEYFKHSISNFMIGTNEIFGLF